MARLSTDFLAAEKQFSANGHDCALQIHTKHTLRMTGNFSLLKTGCAGARKRRAGPGHATKPTATNMSTVYSMDFKSGKLVPLSRTALLPVGSVINYGDMANPRKRYVITGATIGEYGYGQKAVCEDGHASTVHASDPDKYGPTSGGGWHFVRDDDGKPVVLDAAAMAEFLREAEATRVHEAAERQEAADAKAIAQEAERVRILAEFTRYEVRAPEGPEIEAFITAEYSLPPTIARNIATLCGGNVRAACLDAEAWQPPAEDVRAPVFVQQSLASLGF